MICVFPDDLSTGMSASARLYNPDRSKYQKNTIDINYHLVPEKTIGRIFSFVKQREDLQNLREVSKKFDKIARKTNTYKKSRLEMAQQRINEFNQIFYEIHNASNFLN